MPRIAVTCGEVVNKIEPWSPVVHGQSQTYLQALIDSGGVPFMPPITDDPTVSRALYDMADAIVFAGGNDPDPALYGQQPHATVSDVSVARDRFEMQWLRWALADDKPFLAICRGMQLLNISRQGTLFQDIPSQRPNSLDHNHSTKLRTLADTSHTLRLEPESRLAALLGATPIGSNTHHHQGIDQLGQGLVAVAWSSDGLIEAIELPGKTFVVGVQSHPESLAAAAEPRWHALFAGLTKAARQASPSNNP